MKKTGLKTILAIIQRDVRVTAGGIRSIPITLPCIDAARFAQTIIGRYGARSRSGPPANLKFVQNQPGVIMQSVQQHWQYQVTPRLMFTVLAGSRPAGLGRAGALAAGPPSFRSIPRLAGRIAGRASVMPKEAYPAERMVRRLLARDQAFAPSLAAGASAARQSEGRLSQERRLPGRLLVGTKEVDATERIVRRLFARNQRLEPSPTGKVVVTPPVGHETQRRKAETVPARVAWRPVSRVFQQLAQGSTEEKFAVPTPVGVQRDARLPLVAESNVQPGKGVLPADVNRLTDQVIQAIDQRIIAQRERLGRI